MEITIKPWPIMTSHDLRHYSTILTELEKLDVPYCIVGGHSVGIWAERFLDSSQVEGGFPLLSKDLDIRGGVYVANIIEMSSKERCLQMRRGNATISFI